MSAIVKCSSCNIVINELLCFIQNQLPFMDEDTLVRLCAGAFTPDEINYAKDVLYSSMATVVIKSRRNRMDQRDVYAIITAFRRMGPHLPVFVARELYKLPPITFEHIEPTRLVREIVSLQCEVERVKQTCVTKDELQTIRDELRRMSYAPSVVSVKQMTQSDEVVISFNA